MHDFAAAVAVAGFAAGFLLVLGGMLSAAREIHQERKAGHRVTRPGWNREDREALYGPSPARYAVPRGTGLILWPLVAVGRPDLAERYMVRRSARRAQP